MNAEEALQLLDELNASGAPFDEIDDGLLSSDIDVMSSEEEERLDDDIAGLLGDQEESESLCTHNLSTKHHKHHTIHIFSESATIYLSEKV